MPVASLDWRVALVDASGTALSGTSSLNVQGVDAAASAITGKPVLMGINDGGGLVRPFAGINQANNSTGNGIAAVSPTVWDGTNFQKSAQITQATGTSGAGIPSHGPALWDLVGGATFVKQAGDGSGRAIVVGAAAAGAAIAGNPVRVGISDGTNTQDWKQSSASTGSASGAGIPGVAMMALGSGVYQELRSVTATDGGGVNGAMLNTWALPMLYNGATADRARNNVDVIALTSAGRTTTQTLADITTYNCQAILVTLDMTVVGTGSVTVTINYKDPASGKYILLLSGVAITTNITSMYVVDPRTPAVANSIAQKDLGRIIQIVVTANNANSATYTLGYTLVPG